MSYTGGSLTQEICEGDSIDPIDFTVSNGATSAILVGAPDGIVITPVGGGVFRVSGSVNENIGTSSIYNFSVTTQVMAVQRHQYQYQLRLILTRS